MYLEEVRRVPRQSSVRPRRTRKRQGKVSRNDHTSHAPLVGESKTYFFKNGASYHTRTEPRTEKLTTQFSHGQPLAPKPSISSLVVISRNTLFREVMVIHIDTVALRTKGQKSVCVFKHFEEGQSQTKWKNQPRMDLIYSLPALKSKAASTEDASLTQWKGEKAYRMVERGAYVPAKKENHRTMPLRHPRTNLSHPRAHGLKVPTPAARPSRTGLHLQDETYEQSDQIDRIRAHRRLPVRA